MIDEKSYRLIDAYLKNELSAQDEIDFKELTKNAAFLEELEIQKQLYAINSSDYEVDNFLKKKESKHILESIQTAEKNYFKAKRKPKMKKLPFYGVAASIVLMLTYYIGFIVPNDTLQTHYAENVNWNELPSLTERVEEENRLSKAEEAFKDENYKEAIAIFENYLVANPNNSQVLTYLGASYIKSNKDTLALETFYKLTQTATIDSIKGYWYMALIHLKNKNKEDAIVMLNNIVSDKHNFKYEKAKKILDEITK